MVSYSRGSVGARIEVANVPIIRSRPYRWPGLRDSAWPGVSGELPINVLSCRGQSALNCRDEVLRTGSETMMRFGETLAAEPRRDRELAVD